MFTSLFRAMDKVKYTNFFHTISKDMIRSEDFQNFNKKE